MLPSGIVEWLRAQQRPSEQLWQGVYGHFHDVPVRGLAFESDQWIIQRAEWTRRLKGELAQLESGSRSVESRYLLLPACVAAMAECMGPIRVLDFGGAMGVAYAYFRALVVSSVSFEYNVVDNRRSCLEGTRIFDDDKRVHFFEDLDSVVAADVVLMSGVLQYLGDYRAVVCRIVKRFRPRLFLITLVPVGTFPTYASAQVNLSGTRMAAWFFNSLEIESLFNGLGYCLTFRGTADQAFDMSNFPRSHRLPHMSNLVFVRSEGTPLASQ